ncbi:hypothetical protein QR680_016332 [Steinernema hermaphroditum]|uniref:Uncharacterized protein n=1 Tax=Steinernema hermaphroditum TaxID=289476 RepID=A0AA39LLU1_9BILA|nr:hypothetical protein QR680_016332 [Steinernema hermaphroditum]
MFIQSNRFIYDVATLSLFVKRLLIVLFPLNPLRTVTKCYNLLGALAVLAVVIGVGRVYITDIISNGAPVPDDCFAPSCMSQHRINQTIFTIRLILTLSILFSGTALLVVLRKTPLMQKPNEAKVNKMVRYVFYLRIILEFLPVVVDQMLAITASKPLSFYIGPYGAMGYTLECCVGTFFYFRVFSKNTLTVASRSAT